MSALKKALDLREKDQKAAETLDRLIWGIVLKHGGDEESVRAACRIRAKRLDMRALSTKYRNAKTGYGPRQIEVLEVWKACSSSGYWPESSSSSPPL
jgi:hypothetical protein